MTAAQKERELERVIDATRSLKVEGLINWLGHEAIKNPHHRADWRTVFTNVVDRKVKPNTLQPKDMTRVKNLAERARKHIDGFYQQFGVDRDVWLDFPTDLAAQERVGEKGRYAIRFCSGPRPDKTRKAVSALKLRPAAAFWDEMIQSQDPKQTLFIYPAEPKEKRREDTGEKYVDDRGLESGSGEVAAAFLVGACTAHLHDGFSIRRSIDMHEAEFDTAHSCFVYLGSSMECKILESFRSRKPWKDLQWFHFHGDDNKGNQVGSVWEGKLGATPRKVHPYRNVVLRSQEVDYALVSFFKAPRQLQSIIAIQGISSAGTWAGAKFMTDDIRIQELRAKMNLGAEDELPSFELLLRVSLSDYRPADIKIHRLRLHQNL